MQGAVTEFVESLPTKMPTFSGDALGDVLMCTCRNQIELLNQLSIIRRIRRRLICFSSNLHVAGFSSCRITTMIHSYPLAVHIVPRLPRKAAETKGPRVSEVCVCVNHLKRCKTSTADFIRFCSISCRGAVNLIPSTAQRRRWFEIVISGLIIPTYLQISNFHFVVNGNRLSPEPACRSFAGFFVLLHCCRNLYFSAVNRGRTTWFRWISCL